MRRILILGLVVGLGLTGTILLLSGAAEEADGPVREVVLTAQDMRFNRTNPPVHLRQGESVDLLVRNAETAQIVHDLTIPGMKLSTPRPLGPGDEARLPLKADRPGTYIYTCTYHNGLMTGRLIVAPR